MVAHSQPQSPTALGIRSSGCAAEPGMRPRRRCADRDEPNFTVIPSDAAGVGRAKLPFVSIRWLDRHPIGWLIILPLACAAGATIGAVGYELAAGNSAHGFHLWQG